MTTDSIWFRKRILPVIPADKSIEFFKNANNSVLTTEFLKSCSDASAMIKKKQDAIRQYDISMICSIVDIKLYIHNKNVQLFLFLYIHIFVKQIEYVKAVREE